VLFTKVTRLYWILKKVGQIIRSVGEFFIIGQRFVPIDISIELTSLLPVTSCIVDSAATYIMVVKFINTIWPPPPQLSLHRRAALSSNSNGTRSVYSRENPKSSLYCRFSIFVPSDHYRQLQSAEVRSKLSFVKVPLVITKLLKGTLTRDFRPLVFFIKQLPLGP
jgi:hypothetical protein